MKGVGGVGGSADVEYALRAALMVPIASHRLRFCAGTEGTDALSGPDGAATLVKFGGTVSQVKSKRESKKAGLTLGCRNAV